MFPDMNYPLGYKF